MNQENRQPLPEPDSPEVSAIFSLESERRLYGLLYARRDTPPATYEIQDFITEQFGESQSEAMRRLRSLRGRFEVERFRDGRLHRYRLVGWKEVHAGGMRVNVSRRIRAQVLSPMRCAQCGQTPLDDHVKLCVDHKIPVAWGGNNDLSNLQPLCEACNGGKRDFYATYDKNSDQIRAAVQHEEPHMRIGELLKAFHGEWVAAELIGAVASMKQYQDDWQRRLRELRVIGWDYENRVRRSTGGKPAISEYRLKHWEPWPDGSIRTVIDREKRSVEGKPRNERRLDTA
ncbi:HNH endonuclease signature motif containing protein [Streptomyces sp. NPDC101062]|uniref:HNH endonuclease signature motif containing protein n=1 Tax=unclassified Streptomyces TaxID=2593676 RepID=UPI00381CD921